MQEKINKRVCLAWEPKQEKERVGWWDILVEECWAIDKFALGAFWLE